MNIFVIATPLQLLNAIEAKNYFQLAPEECLLVIYEGFSPMRKKTLEQLQAMIIQKDWSDIYYNKQMNNRFGWIQSFLFMRQLIKKIKKVKKVFIGEYRVDFLRDFINNIKYQEAYSIDDGNGTIQLLKNFNLYKSYLTKPKGIDRFYRLIKKIMFGLNDNDVSDIRFFTYYKINGYNKVIVHNSYSFFKKMSSENTVTDQIYLLGTNIAELDIIDKTLYMTYVKKIKNYYSGYDVIYIPHRGEWADKIEQIRDQLGMPIKILDTCIEYELCTKGFLPRTICSFYSAALENCHTIFGDKINVQSFYIRINCNPEYRMQVEEIYSYYKQMLDVIDISEDSLCAA